MEKIWNDILREISWKGCNIVDLVAITIKIMIDKTSILGFIDVLIVFIKQKQVKANRVKNAGNKWHKETNSSWAKKYYI